MTNKLNGIALNGKEEQDNMINELIKIKSVKQQLMAILTNQPNLNYLVIKGFDSKEYIYESNELITLTRKGLNGIEEVLYSKHPSEFKRNLDNISKGEVKLVRSHNKLIDDRLYRLHFITEKAYRIDRDINYEIKKVSRLEREVKTAKLKLELLKDHKENINYSELKQLNEALNKVEFYKEKDYYTETNEFFKNL